MKKHFLSAILCLSFLTLGIALLTHAAKAGEATQRARALCIPTLDDMAGDWMPMESIVNPPSLHNGRHMLIVDRDLTSYFFSPGGWLYNLAAYGDAKESTLWKRGHPAVKLKLDGVEYPARETQYAAYRALRRNTDCNGISVISDTRMVDEARSILTRVTLTNTTRVARKFRASLAMAGSLQPDGVGVANTFQRAGTVAVIRPSRKPDSVDIDAYIVTTWNYDLVLAPGANVTLGFVSGDEDMKVGGTDGFIQGDIGNQKGDATDARVADLAKDFEVAFAAACEKREARWADAFTPGNGHFSGHLPILITTDAALLRNYYMGIATLLCLERTQFPVHPRSFVTNGERDDGTQFFGDLALLPTVWALLEPKGMKATLRRWLVQNVRNGAWIDLRQTQGFDGKHYDHMMGYAYNACNFLYVTDAYLRTTGDTAFLHEKLENGQTLFERMDSIGADWKTLPKLPDGTADFGGNECLLECAPAYTHGVASMNAQCVWMLRTLAAWHEARGNGAKAKTLREEASAVVPVAMRLYRKGEGVWNATQPDGRSIEVRHCIDYIYAGNALADDLSTAQKAEMNAFVEHELFTRDWMRAMSRKDPAAPMTNRTDHGPNGSYDVWIPLTVGTMWKLGNPQGACDFFRRVSVVTREGPFTQAHEFFGPTCDTREAPVRISKERGNMRESCGGGTFSEVVLSTLFGVSPAISGQAVLVDPKTPRPFEGILKNVRVQGKLMNFKADQKGVHILTD